MSERMNMPSPGDDGSAKKKKAPKKTSLGNLPVDIGNIKKVTTDSGEDVARSVGVAPPQTGGGLMNFNPAGGPSMACSPPSLMGGRSNMMGSKQKLAGPRSASTGPSVTARTAPAPSHWNLTDEHVKTLPDFHPLERTAVFVPHSSAPTVARRVSNVLRSRSISVEFINSKAKAKCLTSDNVDFRIRLYRGKNKFSHGIIVEVQRRYGFSTTFHSDVTAILDGAEGKTTTTVPPPTSLSGSSSSLTPPPSLVPADEDVLPQDADLVSLKIASDMLAPSTNADLDRKAMGLDGLAALTDPYKVGNATATRASAEILGGSANPVIRDAILDLVLKKPAGVDSLDANAEDEGVKMLRPRAMIVLSNVFGNLTGTDTLLNLKSIVSRDIVPSLLRDTKTAASDPRGADLAVRTLLPILKTFGDDERFVSSELDGAYGLLVEAQGVGEARFDSLREHSTLCLRALESR